MNLYYGALRGSPHRWLDVAKYFQILRNADDLRRIHYCTALVNGPAQKRQKVYLQALATTAPLVNVILGKFKMKHLSCGVSACSYTGSKSFQAPEEKRTDVNVAVQMLEDAYDDLADYFVLVSGDSDLVPAVNALKARCPNKKVFVYIPTRNPIRGAAVELRSSADRDRDLPLNILPLAQFPASLPDGSGGTIVKPTGW